MKSPFRICLALLATLLLVAQLPAPSLAALTTGARFTDLTGHWAEPQVNRAASLLLVSGYPDGSYRPGSPVTRAEFLKMAVQVSGLPTRTGTGGFADLDRHWVVGQGYIQAAVDAHLVVPADFADPTAAPGVAPRYEPDRPINRYEVAVIATRLMGKQGEAMALRGAPLAFTDSVPYWAGGFVAIATSAGIMQGYPDGTFGGTRTLTRAEAAVIALRLLETAVAEGTVAPPAGLAPVAPRTVPVWEAASWNVSTLELPPDTALNPSDAMALTTAPDGTLYLFADGQFYRIGPDGTAVLVAQAPVSPGTNAIAADNAGNLYLTQLNQVLRITPDGQVAPWVGSGENTFADGIGTAAGFTAINGMCSDPAGNLYVIESRGRVRKVDRQGRVTTLAGLTPLQEGALWSPWGTYLGPLDGPGYLVALGWAPGPCAADQSGNVYIATGSSIRRIAANGTTAWFAGNPTWSGYADGLRAEAQFRSINAMAVDAWGDLWIADSLNQRIRRITPDGRVYTVAGGGFAGTASPPTDLIIGYTGGRADGPGPDARLYGPAALALAGGKLYVAENGDLFADPNRIPGIVPRHLRVISGSAAAYPAAKAVMPVAGAGLVPAFGVPGAAPQGPITVAYALYGPVESLRLTVDGTTVTTGSEKPYTGGWDATAAAPGPHDLQVTVRLPDLGWVEGGRFPVQVLSEPRTNYSEGGYALITPAPGSWVAGRISLTAAGDGGPLEFRVDGQSLAQSHDRVLTVAWDSSTVADGEHTVELGHQVPGQAELSYDQYPVRVINQKRPPREDDLGPGLRVFLGGNRLTYQSATPRVVDDSPYLPFWETMDRAAVLMSRDGPVLTARKGEYVVRLNVETGEVTVHDPRFPDHTYVLEHRPIQEKGVVLVPFDFMATAMGLNGAWLPESQTVWWW